MPRDPRDFLPLKDLVFRVLIALAERERHGWGLLEALNADTTAVLPGHLYRTLDRMLNDRLIEERDHPAERSAAPPNKRGTAPTRFFRITPFGRAVAGAETRRLESLIERSRASKLAGGPQ